MKVIIVSLLLFTSHQAIKSQNFEVQFVRKANVEFQLRNVTDEAIRTRVAQQLQKDSVLFSFRGNKKQSLVTRNTQTNEGNGNQMSLAIKDSIFIDYLRQEKQYKSYFEGGVEYLIRDPFKKDSWELTGREKEIEGYKCKEVKRLNTEGTPGDVLAWYTDELPFFIGPDTYRAESGAILEVHSNNFVLRATHIHSTNKELKISAPKQGTVIDEITYTKKLNEYKASLFLGKN